MLKTQLKTLKDELKRARQPLEALKAIEAKVEDAEEKLQTPVKRRRQTTDHKPQSAIHRPLSVGEKVILKSLGNEGTIVSIDDREAEIQAGPLRMRVPLEGLKRKAEETSEQPSIPSGHAVVNRKSSIALAPSPGMELDLRGMMSEDALDKLETYLDKAYMAGMPFVRIIHGKGTGKLRQVVRAALKDHPHIRSFEEGGEKEGGEGVTVAKLAAG